MSSIFGHDLAAVYRDRAYMIRPNASWLAIGCAFAVGVVATVVVMKVPAGSPNERAQATSPQSNSKPARTETAAKPPVRVIAPDVVPPPPNVTAVAREPRADPNVGAAPREQVVETTPAETVPMPPPKPADLRVAAASPAVPDSPTAPPAAAAGPVPPTPAAILPPSASPESQLHESAKPTRKQNRAARREARRLEREERRRLGQDRREAERSTREAGHMIYRRYDDGRALAYGDPYAPHRRGFFGLFDFD